MVQVSVAMRVSTTHSLGLGRGDLGGLGAAGLPPNGSNWSTTFGRSLPRANWVLKSGHELAVDLGVPRMSQHILGGSTWSNDKLLRFMLGNGRTRGAGAAATQRHSDGDKKNRPIRSDYLLN